jgi:hypothetical protein
MAVDLIRNHARRSPHLPTTAGVNKAVTKTNFNNRPFDRRQLAPLNRYPTTLHISGQWRCTL